MKKNKIIDVLIFIFGLVFALLLIAFQKQNDKLFIVAFLGCIVFGILLLFKFNKLGLLLEGIGIGGIVSLIIYYNGILKLGNTVTFFFCLSLSVMLILSLILGIIYRISVMKKFNLIIEGEVVDLVKNPNVKKDYYMPVYKYVIDGNEYFVEDINFKHNFVPNIGQIKKLYVDPNDPLQVYFLPSKFNDIKNVFGILFLSILCIIVIISLF